MTQTNPEQWAVELWEAASDEASDSSVKWRRHASEAAALTIQAAFAEREARLVELLDRAAAIIPEHTYINWHCALAALKDRTHG